jgi:ribosomal protein S18 acetylase RimI-like enzyme
MAGFRLPVLKGGEGGTREALLRLATRAEGLWSETLGERVEVEGGEAVVSAEFSRVPAANRVQGVREDGDVAQTVAAVDAAFGARGVSCLEWSFGDEAGAERFSEMLLPRGYVRKRDRLYRMEQPGALQRAAEVMVIPGRASFQKLGDLAEGAERGWGTAEAAELLQLREAAVRVLDDPQVDCLLALVGEEAVGAVYLVSVGEGIVLQELYVHPAWVRRGIGRTLLASAVEVAARSRARHLLLFCEEGNEAAQAMYEKAGFRAVATRGRLVREAGGGG